MKISERVDSIRNWRMYPGESTIISFHERRNQPMHIERGTSFVVQCSRTYTVLTCEKLRELEKQIMEILWHNGNRPRVWRS